MRTERKPLQGTRHGSRLHSTGLSLSRYLVLTLTGTSISCAPGSSEKDIARSTAEASALSPVVTRVHVPAQPVDVIYHAILRGGSPVQVGTAILPTSAYSVDTKDLAPKPGRPVVNVATSKLDPALERRLTDVESTGMTGGTVDVVVTFREDIDLPRFPEPVENEVRSSTANVAAQEVAEQLVNDVKAARAASYAQLTQELTSQYGAAVQDQFWLIKGMQIRLPIDRVRALATRADVQFIEERQKNIPPPQNESVNARAVMSTDPYFNLNLTSGWIGLLDTGIRASHTLLTHHSYLRDCVNGGSDCNTGTDINTDDNFWNHGTSSASELTANSNLGDANRGVTAIYIDSFKIYSTAGLDTGAAVRGFQNAIPALDRVIVAEIQDTGGENGSIATAADAAFNAGAVVVAANGNAGSNPSTVRSPGNARKALGVGAADVQTLALQDYSGRGPTNDGRTKPDIVGPTNVRAASNASSTALQVFTGTSAATPNAAGATALMRNFIRGNNFEVDPGQINALMIVSGSNTVDSVYNNNIGSGMVSMPVDGHLWWSSVTAAVSSPSSRPMVDVALNISPSPTQAITVALWWPESIGGSHSDVDVRLLNPSGVQVAASSSISSVFEKARIATGSLPAGNWTVRIVSYAVPNPQRVYFAVKLQ
jgi:serine protease AprX